MTSLICHLKEQGRIRTGETYQCTLNSFMRFRNGEEIILDEMNQETIEFMEKNIEFLENLRVKYNDTKDKTLWYSIIQLLPESYNQMRTCTFSYENAVAMYYSRKNHKLDEWHTFCDWVCELPYFMELFPFIKDGKQAE